MSYGSDWPNPASLFLILLPPYSLQLLNQNLRSSVPGVPASHLSLFLSHTGSFIKVLDNPYLDCSCLPPMDTFALEDLHDLMKSPG